MPNPKIHMPNPKIHRVPLGKKNSAHPETLTLILTQSPNRVNPRRKKGKGRRGRAILVYLAAVRRYYLAGARGKERAGRGHCSSGSGHRGAAARPLDGGALTRWGTRTPARGPATAPWLTAPPFSLALGCARLAAV